LKSVSFVRACEFFLELDKSFLVVEVDRVLWDKVAGFVVDVEDVSFHGFAGYPWLK